MRYRFASAYPFRGTRLREKADVGGLWLDDCYRQDDYASTGIPVLRNAIAMEPDDPGHKRLKSFENDLLTDIYSSTAYASRVGRFLQTTGARFAGFYARKWKETVSDIYGAIPRW